MPSLQELFANGQLGSLGSNGGGGSEGQSIPILKAIGLSDPKKSILESFSTQGWANSSPGGPGKIFSGGEKYLAFFQKMHEDIKKAAAEVRIEGPAVGGGGDSGGGDSWVSRVSSGGSSKGMSV